MEQRAVIIDDPTLKEAFFLGIYQNKLFDIRHEGAALICSGPELERLIDDLALRLADFIFGRREEWRLWLICRLRYDFFTPREMGVIAAEAFRLLHEDVCDWAVFSGQERCLKLRRLLQEYLYTNPVLNIEGFIRFRMSGYDEYLLATLTFAADELLGKQEDEQYLKLLSAFLKEQKSSYAEVHLLICKGYYSVWGKKGEEGLRMMEGGQEQGYEDLLVTSILLFAPQKLIIHLQDGGQSKMTVQTLIKLFGARASLCRGCSLCHDLPSLNPINK